LTGELFADVVSSWELVVVRRPNLLLVRPWPPTSIVAVAARRNATAKCTGLLNWRRAWWVLSGRRFLTHTPLNELGSCLSVASLLLTVMSIMAPGRKLMAEVAVYDTE